jgi:hypothetical protein
VEVPVTPVGHLWTPFLQKAATRVATAGAEGARRRENYRIYILNTYQENGQLLYDAVWRPGTNGETQLYQLGYSDYQKQYDQLWKAGSRIALLNTYEVG